MSNLKSACNFRLPLKDSPISVDVEKIKFEKIESRPSTKISSKTIYGNKKPLHIIDAASSENKGNPSINLKAVVSPASFVVGQGLLSTIEELNPSPMVMNSPHFKQPGEKFSQPPGQLQQ